MDLNSLDNRIRFKKVIDWLNHDEKRTDFKDKELAKEFLTYIEKIEVAFFFSNIVKTTVATYDRSTRILTIKAHMKTRDDEYEYDDIPMMMNYIKNLIDINLIGNTIKGFGDDTAKKFKELGIKFKEDKNM